jgi:hypothetical protein
MHASLLFTAPETGTYNCEIHANTSDNNNTGYHMTALADAFPAGTWLEIDNFTTDAPQWWQNPTCDSKGSSDTNCVFLGRNAGPDALTADLTAHMQITSCPVGTSSCPWAQCGGPNYLNPVSVLPTGYGEATFTTHLDFIQLDQFGTWCRVLSTPETKYTISNSVHHFLVDYVPPLILAHAVALDHRRPAFNDPRALLIGHSFLSQAASEPPLYTAGAWSIKGRPLGRRWPGGVRRLAGRGDDAVFVDLAVDRGPGHA